MIGVANAQIAGGTYSIGSGGDYETLNAAITDLNTNGLAGNVTFEIKDGHVEDAYNVINSYTGNTDYELIIRPEAGATSVELTRTPSGKILDFIGARNIILDGRAGGSGDPILTIYNGSTSGALAGISFEGSTSDVTVKYCNIVYRGFGIRTVGGGANDPENVIIENCVFSTPAINENIPSLWAINHNCTSTSSMTIRNNVFESPNLGTGSVDTYMAMYIRSGADIYNNMIAIGDIPADNIYGIRTNFGGFVKNINHNTIAFVGGSTSNSATDVYPLYFQHGGTANVTNNVVINNYDCGSGCTRGIIKELSTYGGSTTAEDNAWGSTTSTVAQNLYYSKDGEDVIISTEFPDNSTLPASYFSFVDFASNDLELTETGLSSSSGFRTTNPAQTTDIYGNARALDIATKGAVESAFPADDANIYAMSAPELSSVSLQDFGTFGRINIEIENPTTDLTFTPTFTLAPGATIDPEGGQPFDYSRIVNFSVFFDVTAANGTDIKRWSLNVTGVNRWPGGTYSVGSGKDFESISEAANSLAIFGIDGDVILELEDGYSGDWGNFYDRGGFDDYTITIRPEAGATEINAPFSGTGGKNIIIDGRPGGVGESVLSFRALSCFVSGTHGAFKHITFSNQVGNGQVYGLRVYGNSADVTIENCTFTRPAALGSPTGNAFSALLIQTGQDLTIRNNKIYDFKYTPTAGSAEFNAIRIVGDISGKTEIYNNAISIKPEKFAPQNGILIESATTGEVEIFHNTINIEDSGTGDQADIFSGITVLANPSILSIQNNIISNTSPGTRKGILYSSVSGERNVDFNNVSGTAPFTYTGTITDATEFKSAFINSTTEDVTFTDTSIGDLSLNSSLNNNSYVRTTFDAGIAEDIEGTTRGSFPMKGSYDAAGSGFNDILSLNFEGAYNLVIDADNGTVSVDADPALNRSNLPVDITIPPGASIDPDPSAGQNYTSPMEFTVTSENDVDKVWTVTMQDAQVTPSDLSLSSNTVVENTPTNTTFATFITTDSNTEDTHTYQLVTGDGDDNNNRFVIVDDGLQSTAGLNFEGFNPLYIRVRTTDNTGRTFEKALTINVTDINEAPEDVYPGNNEFDEGIEANTGFTDILVDDEDLEDVHTFTLVAGEGDTDNDKFEIGFNEIEGSFLTTLVDFDFETQDEFSIRLRATDAGGLFVESIANIYLYDVDEAPTDIILSSDNVDENSSPGTVVATLSTEDDDIGDTHTYTLVSGEGDEDNNAFQISDDQLLNEGNLNFETKSSYNIRIQTEDDNGDTFEKAFVIAINDVNEAPTDITLDNKSVNESMPLGTLIGILTTEDIDEGDTHTYTIEEGCVECRTSGDATDNFIIEGNELRTNTIFDFETQDEYFITITSTDEGGLTYPNGYIIVINDLPAQVTAIELDNTSINENMDAGELVGSLSTFGEDLSGSFTYDLVAGTGSDDNASFTISNDQLLSNESFDFETKNSYSIRVMVDDGSLTFEEIITISVNDISEAPTDISLNPTSITENNEVGDVIGTFTTTDEDAGETYTYLLVSGDGDTDNASFTIANDELRAGVILDFEAQSSYAVRVETNDGNGGTFQKAFTITLENENESISVANPLADQTVTEGFGSLDIDLSSVFVDTDGDPLTFGVSSANTSVVTVSETDGTLTLTEAGVGTTIVTVTADDGSGSTTSDEFEITVDAAPLGLAEDLNIKVYPNPTADFISIGASDLLNVKLYDLNGRMMQAKKGQNITLDVRSIPSGVYVLRVSDGTRSVNHRIIKTN